MRALKDQAALPSGGYWEGKRRILPNVRPQKGLVRCARERQPDRSPFFLLRGERNREFVRAVLDSTGPPQQVLFRTGRINGPVQ
jgi:hypothetical protein